MAKNKAAKPPKSRPASTSALTQPVQSEHSAQITEFSHDATMFAQLTQAVDRARLRVYATHKAGVVADFLLPESLACNAMTWVAFGARGEQEPTSAKKRKAAAKAEKAGADSASAPPSEHVALGMSDGTVLIYAPQTARVVRVLVASTQDSSAASLTSLSARNDYVWGVTANGWVHGWALGKLASASPSERIPPARHFLPDSKTPMTLVQGAEPGPSHRMLTAHHAIALYDLASEKPSPCMSFTGHATPVQHMVWTSTHTFVSAAANDRHLYCWFADVPHAGAMLSLDAPARHLAAWMDGEHATLLVISERGTAKLYRIPRDMPKAKGLATVSPCTDIHTSFEPTELVSATRTPHGTLRYARIVKGFKVVLDEAPMYGEDGKLLPTMALTTSAATKPDVALRDTQRYKDAAGAGGSRAELPLHTAASAALLGTEGGLLPDDASSAHDLHDAAMHEGVDEPTLAQRLKALKVQRGDAARDDDEESEGNVAPVGGASLASSLTQALHSGDHSLLTSCLVHSDPVLIRTTVRRISGPLAVRLLEACVERLNRGGVKSKGALGSGRARGIVEWIHQTLTFHTAYLMSLPNLVARLSQLHHSLAARLASHERLLALKGRMELVMSQIDMQMSYTADEVTVPVQGQKLGKKSTPAELESKQNASQQQQHGQTWTEPDDDEEQVEEIGLTAGEDTMLDDDDDDDEGDVDNVEEMEEEDVDLAAEDDDMGMDEEASDDDDVDDDDDDDSDE